MRKLQAITNVPQTLVDRLSEETWSKLEAIDVKARSPYLEAERIRKEIEALNKKLMAKIKRVDDQVEDAFELIGLEGKATVAERLMCFPETKARIKDQEEIMSAYAGIATLDGYWSDTGQRVITLHDWSNKDHSVERIAEVMGDLIEHVIPNNAGDRRFMVANSSYYMVLHADGTWGQGRKHMKSERLTLEKAAARVHACIRDRDENRDWEEN